MVESSIKMCYLLNMLLANAATRTVEDGEMIIHPGEVIVEDPVHLIVCVVLLEVMVIDTIVIDTKKMDLHEVHHVMNTVHGVVIAHLVGVGLPLAIVHEIIIAVCPQQLVVMHAAVDLVRDLRTIDLAVLLDVMREGDRMSIEIVESLLGLEDGVRKATVTEAEVQNVMSIDEMIVDIGREGGSIK